MNTTEATFQQLNRVIQSAMDGSARPSGGVPLRSSALKVGWLRGMSAMRHYIENGTADSPAMAFGRLVHRIALVGDRPVVFHGVRRGKEWEAFKAQHDGEEIYTPSECERAVACVDSMLAHPISGPILRAANANREWHIAYDDDQLGKCTATIDLYSPSVGLVDIKTAANIGKREFGRTCGAMGYHLQMGWYRRALRASGIAVDRPDVFSIALKVRIIAVESSPPYDVAVYVMPQSAVEAGERMAVEVGARFRSCERSGEYPGAHLTEEEIEIPEWHMADQSPAVPTEEITADQIG